MNPDRMIDNEFTVSVPIDQAWEVLTDLAGIAPCLPGAQLTGSEGDMFMGKIKIKVGPVTSEYAGTASFSEKDDASYRGSSRPRVRIRVVPARTTSGAPGVATITESPVVPTTWSRWRSESLSWSPS
jgi:hypothetical protein